MSSLYCLISKTLGDQFCCPEHHLPYQSLSKDIQLLCDLCPNQDTLPLQTFFDNPLAGMLWYHHSSEYSIEWMNKRVGQDIATRLIKSKQALERYVDDLQAAISAQCQALLLNYNTQVDAVLSNTEKSLYQLQKLVEVYTTQLEEEINGNDLSFENVRAIIRGFLTVNQDPTEAFVEEAERIREELSRYPYLKTTILTQHYQQICDPFKWKLENFVANPAQSSIFEGVDSIHLSNNQHILKYNRQGVSIYNLRDNSPSSVCNKHPVDFCYQINGFKVVGCNEREVVVFSYLNPSEIEVLAVTRTKFPQDISYQRPYLKYRSENVNWRWNMHDPPECDPQLKPAGTRQPLHRPLVQKPNRFALDMDNFVTLN